MADSKAAIATAALNLALLTLSTGSIANPMLATVEDGAGSGSSTGPVGLLIGFILLSALILAWASNAAKPGSSKLELAVFTVVVGVFSTVLIALGNTFGKVLGVLYFLVVIWALWDTTAEVVGATAEQAKQSRDKYAPKAEKYWGVFYRVMIFGVPALIVVIVFWAETNL